MASLNSMRSNLNYWNRQKREAEKEIRDLEKRRIDIEAVQRELFSVSVKNSDDINGKMSSVIQKIGAAITYGKGGQQEIYVSTRNAEEIVGVDFYLTQTEKELQREIKAIESQITEEEFALFRAKGRISDLKRDIYAEERQLKEEEA